MEFSNFEKFKTLMKKIHMENAGEKALGILQTMGYLAPDCIPTGMFLCLFTNLDELNIAVKLLQRYSFIQFREDKEISIKKDTQTNIRNYLKDMMVEEVYLKQAIKLVKLSLKNSNGMSHGISVFSFTKEHPTLVEESILLAVHIVYELIKQRRNSDAYLFVRKAVHDMFQKVNERKKCLGEIEEKTLQTEFDIGVTYQHLGDYYTALNIFKDLAGKCAQSLGERNRHILDVKFNLGAYLFHLGEYEDAYKINKDIYKKYINASSKISRDCCVCKRNMGDILVMQNKTELSLRIFPELLEECKEVYEPYEVEVTKLKLRINKLYQQERKKSKLETVHSVSMAGNLEKGTAFIQTGKDINDQKEDGKMLHYAAECGHVKIAKILLKTGAKYNSKNKSGATPLDLAKSFETRKLFLAIKGLFQDSKAGVEDKILQYISEYRSIVNVKDKNGYTALHWTAYGGHTSIVELLLEFGADTTLVSDKFNSPLHIAASKGHTEIVELLLQSVVRCNRQEFINGKTETRGNTPLHVAAERGYIDVVKILLSYGAVSDIRNKEGKTPLELSNGMELLQSSETL